ncbi:6-carboxytetrahydropterin synthase QueD [Sporohalobacter salinus]|uniref:6-carboxytetrahydropterin synthase QueD n=1 Tax=Sporohalobacter salinus TaxID=1494606 RepID=UPI0019618FD0|nr:6-carboxytetrahydropterin synthase QueD [Sporohalobacter salinus]MBM7623336.1 6-pyruvoyltetrahydropterin/6-carboxytetrahydropterin synthase [Sporohalobacter salinus]
MSRISVTKSFSWDMAHMLAGHENQCKNLHGHTYKLEVEVASKSGGLKKAGAGQGMIIDFKDLKQVVRKEIVSPLDHAFLYWVKSPDEVEHQLASTLQEAGRKVVSVDFRPTAENMANYFLETLQNSFAESNIEVLSIRVWETSTSYAEVKGVR